MLSEKKCRGTNEKTKGFGCGKLVPQSLYGKANRVYGLGKSCGCYTSWLTSTDAGKEMIEKATLKVTKPRRELEEREIEEKELKSLNWLLTNTKNTCHDYIKLRDKGKPCISCGQPYNSDHQAGHCFKAELYSTLKFHEFNINGQCVGCNIYKEGNESAYIARLPERIGKENFDELMMLSKKDHHVDFKWSREGLIGIRKWYKDKIKELKK